MNWFNKLIVNWGKSIEASREAKDKLIAEKEQEEIKKRREAYVAELKKLSNIKNKIFAWYDEIAKCFDINEYYHTRTGMPLDFGVGDTVILNKYGLRMDSSNGWDGGAKILLGRGGYNYDENPAPLFCKITNIVVDVCYAHELVDKFFENHLIDEIIRWDDEIVERYQLWLKKRNRHQPYKTLPAQESNFDTSIFDRRGLYVTAHFETLNWDFNPKWGLNLFAFLPDDSEEGKETVNVWKEIYDANETIKALNEKQEHLKATMVDAKKRLLKSFN